MSALDTIGCLKIGSDYGGWDVTMRSTAGLLALIGTAILGACIAPSSPASPQLPNPVAAPASATLQPRPPSTPVPPTRVATLAGIALATATAKPAVAGVEVSMLDDLYSPQIVTIRVGETVTWRNYGGKVHDALSLAGEWSPSLIQPGDRARVTFNKAGKFEYTCSIHSSMGGWVIVE